MARDWVELIEEALELVKEPYRTNLEGWVRDRLDGRSPNEDLAAALRGSSSRQRLINPWPVRLSVLNVIADTVEHFGKGSQKKREQLISEIHALAARYKKK